jgi:hypothetical protein
MPWFKPLYVGIACTFIGCENDIIRMTIFLDRISRLCFEEREGWNEGEEGR